MSDIVGTVVVRFDEDGDISYGVFGDERVRLFIIDERAPNDRVYEWLPRRAPSDLVGIIPPDAEIGSSADERHAAIAARILAHDAGLPHLSAVTPGEA